MKFARRIWLLFPIIFVLSFVTLAQIVPRLTVTNQDALVLDTNGDGLADPGDVIRYTVEIANCGFDSQTAGNVIYTVNPDDNTTFRPGSLTVSGISSVKSDICGQIIDPPDATPPVAVAPPPDVDAVANDDTVSVTNGGSDTVNITANDAGSAPIQVISFGDSVANVGTTPADGTTILSIAVGGGTLDVTIDATGNLNVLASGTTGTGTVSIFYEIQVANGTSDIGQIDISFGDFPTAIDDTLATLGAGNEYTTDVSVTLNVGAGTGLLNNDTLGTPAATLINWGGGDASPSLNLASGASRPFAGGTLTVNADGSFDLVNPTTSGVFTFEYRLDNGIGLSEATVEIYISESPVAVSDSYQISLGAVDSSNAVTDNDSPGAPPAIVDFYADTGNVGGASQVAAPGVYTHPTGNFQVTIDAAGNLTVDASVGGVASGTYSFDYQITNSAGSSVATVTIEIVEGPIAEDDAFSVTIGNALSGDLTVDNGSGADASGTPAFDVLTFGGGDLGGTVTSNTATPGGTSVALAGGTLTITDAGAITLNGATIPGLYTFNYRLESTALGLSDDATVTIEILALPTAVDDGAAGTPAYTVSLGGSVTSTTATGVRDSNDDWTLPNVYDDATVDGYGNTVFSTTPGNPFTIPGSGGVTVTLAADGTLTLDATAGTAVAGDYSFDYQLTNTAGSDTATVYLRVIALPTVTAAEAEQDDASDTFVAMPEQGAGTAPTVSSAADVRFTFSENVTFAAGAYSVVCGTSGDVTASYSAGATPASTVTLTYGGAGLTEGETCTVTLVSANITDADGLALDGNGNGAEDGAADNEIYDFVVDTAPQLTGVQAEVSDTLTTINGSFPTNGLSDVDSDTTLVLTFDEAVNDAGGVTATCTTSGTLSTNGGGLTTAGNGTTTLTITRTAGTYAGGETCTISFTTANITDADSADAPDNLTTPNPATYEFSIASVAVDDAFTVTSHLEARFDTVAPGTTNVLSNDEIPVSTTVTEINGSAANIGTEIALPSGAYLLMESDGDFNYTPPPGVGGGATDNFTYTISSGSSATVTITIDGPVIWYVDLDAANTIYNGTAAFPFNDLAVSANSFDVNAADAANQFIFVYDSASDGSAGQCGLTLLNGQQVIGEGEAATLNSITGRAPVQETVNAPETGGAQPQLSSVGDCFTLGSGNTVRGLDVANTGGYAFIDGGATVGTLTINDVSITGSGGLLSLTNGGTLAAAFSTFSSSGHSATMLDLSGISGSLTSNAGTIIKSAGTGNSVNLLNSPLDMTLSSSFEHTLQTATGIQITGTSGTVSFNGITTVGNSSSPLTANAVVLSNTGNATPVTFSNLNVTTNTAQALVSSTSGNLEVTTATMNCSGIFSNDTHCVDLSDTNISGMTISDLTVGSGSPSGGGLSLVNTPGTTIIQSFNLNAQNSVAVFGSNFGTLSMGTVSPGTVAVSNRAAFDLTNGTVNIRATGMTASNVIDHAINLVGTGGDAFQISGAASISGVAGSNELINLVNVSVTNVNIGTNGTTPALVTLTARRTTGVFMQNVTGTVNIGAYTDTNTANAPGYSVRVENSSGNITFAQANISNALASVVETRSGGSPNGAPTNEGNGDAIFIIDHAGSVTINGGTIANNAGNGIDHRRSAGLNLNGVTINSGTQHAVRMFNPATATSSSTGLTIAMSPSTAFNGFYVLDNGATGAQNVNITLTDPVISNTVSGEDGILFNPDASSNSTFNFVVQGTNDPRPGYAGGVGGRNCSITGFDGDSVQINSAGSASVTSTLDSCYVGEAATNEAAGVTIFSANNSTHDVTISNNYVNQTYQIPALITSGAIDVNVNNSSTMNVAITGNAINDANVAGIDVTHDLLSTAFDLNATISGNYIDNIADSSQGINASYILAFLDGTPLGTLDWVIDNNVLGSQIPAGCSGIQVVGFDTSSRVRISNNTVVTDAAPSINCPAAVGGGSSANASRSVGILVDYFPLDADRLDVTITNNVVTDPNNNSSEFYVRQDGGSVCTNFQSNAGTLAEFYELGAHSTQTAINAATNPGVTTFITAGLNQGACTAALPVIP